MTRCPRCGSTETIATLRGGCFGTFLFVAFMIGIPVVIGMIVPNFWNWVFGPDGIGDFTFFTQGFFWHFLIVSILSGVLAGLLAFRVIKIQRLNPGRVDHKCADCGVAY